LYFDEEKYLKERVGKYLRRRLKTEAAIRVG
jgi:hypothetical protein